MSGTPYQPVAGINKIMPFIVWVNILPAITAVSTDLPVYRTFLNCIKFNSCYNLFRSVYSKGLSMVEIHCIIRRYLKNLDPARVIRGQGVIPGYFYIPGPVKSSFRGCFERGRSGKNRYSRIADINYPDTLFPI